MNLGIGDETGVEWKLFGDDVSASFRRGTNISKLVNRIHERDESPGK
jgi:hypothetical protein